MKTETGRSRPFAVLALIFIFSFAPTRALADDFLGLFPRGEIRADFDCTRATRRA